MADTERALATIAALGSLATRVARPAGFVACRGCVPGRKMTSNGQQRLARAEKNEQTYKDYNERRVAMEEGAGVSEDERVPFACECDDPDCSRATELTIAEYERHAGPPDQFVVAQGHEDPDVEVVVEDRGSFLVVSKPDLKRPNRD